MIGIVRRHVRGRADGEEGIALVVAIALIAVVGMLIASVVAVAMYESRASGRDRQRSQAVMAAEQSIDMLMAQIQGASTATLPCGTLATQPVSVVSDRLTVMPTVQYYDQVGNPLTNCADQGGVRAGVQRADQRHRDVGGARGPGAGRALHGDVGQHGAGVRERHDQGDLR